MPSLALTSVKLLSLWVNVFHVKNIFKQDTGHFVAVVSNDRFLLTTGSAKDVRIDENFCPPVLNTIRQNPVVYSGLNSHTYAAIH